MYRFSVPMVSRTFARDDRERVVETLQKMGVCRVFLAIGSYHFDPKILSEELLILRDNVAFLHDKGFEVGAWMWTFMDTRKDSPFRHVRSVLGENTQSVCPTDESFCAFAAEYLQGIARCGVDIVLYDDDYRYGYLGGGNGCLCEGHLAMMSELLGEPLTREGVAPYLMTGGENRYRSAWQAAKRQSLLGFAKRMREALNEVAPTVRLGVCACFSVWDLDGVSAEEISRALAGDTKPFLRLIGAPYWAVRRSIGGHRLQDVIEVERMERSFCGGAEDMEIVVEGDTYPRPRWICPASFLEGFDQALRADGRFDGIMKYAVDYNSFLPYESGYIKRHLANLPLYDEIDSLFGDKTALGVRVFETMRKYEYTEIPPAVKSEKELSYMTFSYAARMLAAASIPTTYDASDCVGIAFGENARELPLSALKNGMILDLRAAEILRERGVDVGLREKGALCTSGTEILMNTKEHVALSEAKIYRTTVDQRADVKSVFALIDARSRFSSLWDTEDGKPINVTPASYTYENADGERFFVLCFDGQLAADSLLRNYARGDLLREAISYLSQKPFVATIAGNPDLYMLAKQKDDRVAIGLWNFCPDAVDEPVLSLPVDVEVLRTVGCEVVSAGNGTLRLSRIEPYGFAAIEWRIL